MPKAERSAKVVWEGSLLEGKGTIKPKSGAFASLPVTWAARVERSDGMTSPEELIASAHAACFSMALSGDLAQGGHEPERLTVEATSTIDDAGGDLRVTTMVLKVRGKVPGLDAVAFAEAAERAKMGCPVSKALQGNVDIRLDAALE